jgi:hypothetical protein
VECSYNQRSLRCFICKLWQFCHKVQAGVMSHQLLVHYLHMGCYIQRRCFKAPSGDRAYLKVVLLQPSAFHVNWPCVRHRIGMPCWVGILNLRNGILRNEGSLGWSEKISRVLLINKRAGVFQLGNLGPLAGIQISGIKVVHKISMINKMSGRVLIRIEL